MARRKGGVEKTTPKRETATEAREQVRDIAAQIAALHEMTVGELQAKWLEVFGEAARSRHKVWLRKKLAWRIQEQAAGGLSGQALDQIETLAATTPTRQRAKPRRRTEEATPEVAEIAAEPATEIEETEPAKPAKERDPRLPAVGSIIRREDRKTGVVHEVTVLEDGFLYRDQHYRSLSAVARVASGQIYNGFLWAGLIQRPAAKNGGDA